MRARSEVAHDLRCNLCVYDYSGYGESAGSPSVPNTLADIDAVFGRALWVLHAALPVTTFHGPPCHTRYCASRAPAQGCSPNHSPVLPASGAP